MPRATLGARSHVTQPRPNFRSSDNFFLDLRLFLCLFCAYQLRVRPLLGIEAHRINCLEATTIALYPSPTHIVPNKVVRVKTHQSQR